MIVLRETRLDAPEIQNLLAEWNAELKAENPSFSPAGGSIVHPNEFSSPYGVFLLATTAEMPSGCNELRGQTPAGCGGLRRLTPTTAEIKRLFVRRTHRRRSVGRCLLIELERRAIELGFEELRLDTAGNDPAALALFGAVGYQPIADYNANPNARHWFAMRIAPPGN